MVTQGKPAYQYLLSNFVYAFCLCAILFVLPNSELTAATGPAPANARRSIYPHEWGVDRPAGLAYSAQLGQFFLLDKTRPNPTTATIVTITPYEKLVNRAEIDFAVGDALNITFDEQDRRLLLLNRQLTEIAQVALDEQGKLNPGALRRSNIAHLHLGKAQGMAIDASGQRLLILDRAARRVVSLPLNATLEFPADAVSSIDLSALGVAAFQGIAVHPASHRLFIGSPAEQLLYELTQSGELVNRYTTAALALNDPQAFVFAPSADLTDAPETLHLFVADSYLPNIQAAVVEPAEGSTSNSVYLPLITSQEADGSSNLGQSVPAEQSVDLGVEAAKGKGRLGEIVEIALDESSEGVSAAAALLTSLTLVKTVNTSAFAPSSPDPSGIAFIPSLNRLLIADGEVDEIPTLFTGANLFETTVAGALFRTGGTTAYSIEPTGAGFNPANGHIFISDDDKREIFEIASGADGLYGTSDDLVTSFDTAIFNSLDPEDVTYDTTAGALFIIDGVNAEVYRVSPGPNGRFDGIPAAGGDDSVINFDVQILNIFDPEGIYYDSASDHLFTIANNRTRIFEITTTGVLVELYDTTAANIIKNAGITMAPGSNNPSTRNFYIVDRGIDNDVDPTENDGKFYEFSRSANPTPTSTPTNTPGPSLTPTPTNTPGPINTTVKVFVDQDSWLQEKEPNKTHGGEDKLPVKTKSGDSKRAIYHFNLAGIPADATVSSATVNFWIERDAKGSVALHRVTDVWTESGVTWGNTARDFDPTAEGSFIPSNNHKYVPLDITRLVQKWVNGQAPNQGLMLIADSDQEAKFGSRERGSSNERPFLVITYRTP